MREQGYGTDRTAGQRGRTTVAPGRTDVLDLEVAAELLGLGDGLDDVVATFSDSVPQRLEEMWLAARSGDAAGVARAACRRAGRRHLSAIRRRSRAKAARTIRFIRPAAVRRTCC